MCAGFSCWVQCAVGQGGLGVVNDLWHCLVPLHIVRTIHAAVPLPSCHATLLHAVCFPPNFLHVFLCRRSSWSSWPARRAKSCRSTSTTHPSPRCRWRRARSSPSSDPPTSARRAASGASTRQTSLRCCCIWRSRSGARRQQQQGLVAYLSAACRRGAAMTRERRLRQLLLLLSAGDIAAFLGVIILDTCPCSIVPMCNN